MAVNIDDAGAATLWPSATILPSANSTAPSSIRPPSPSKMVTWVTSVGTPG
jgi:hypothetical protein